MTRWRRSPPPITVYPTMDGDRSLYASDRPRMEGRVIDLTQKIRRNLPIWYKPAGSSDVQEGNYVKKAGFERSAMLFIKLKGADAPIYVHCSVVFTERP